MIIFLISISGKFTTVQSSTSLAATAEQEYKSWEETSPENKGFSCQGEKYCSHFKSPIVDWCCYFVGYCIEVAGLDTTECGFSPAVSIWINNLRQQNKIEDAEKYSPTPGNLIFFDYSGRAHYSNGGYPTHIGIVTTVNDDTITVIAGNEYNGQTSDWAYVSYVNKYTLKVNDDNIACYGTVGDDDITTYGIDFASTKDTVKTTLNVISHNEIGCLYDNIDPSKYGSVVANDNGGLSVGIYGWHENKARELLKTAYSVNSNEIIMTCKAYGSTGKALMSEFINDTKSWVGFRPSNNQCKCIKAVLLTKAGKLAQDKTALNDANDYIKTCKEHGITKDICVIYCSDILNQWGIYSFNSNLYSDGSPGVLNKITGTMSLKSIYFSKAGWGSQEQYKNRRTWTYNYLSKGL